VGAALARRPELARVGTLWFGPGWKTGHLKPLLGGSPHLSGLHALRLGDPIRGPREPALERLIAGLALPALDSLAVDLGPHPEPDWDPYLPRSGPPLRRLYFSGEAERYGDWEYPDLDWLLRSRHGRALTDAAIRLAVDLIDYGPHVATAPLGGALRRLKDSRLESLTVVGSLADLLACPDWGSVTRLASHGFTDDSELCQLLAAPQARPLRSLALEQWLHYVPGPDLPAALKEEAWPYLRRLSMRGPVSLLSGSYRRHLLRLDLALAEGHLTAVEAVAAEDLPQLRWLTLAVASVSELAPLFNTTRMPNLCTLVLAGLESLNKSALRALARAPGLPHLSLVGARRYAARSWYVLRDGEGIPVAPGEDPVEEDWLEPDPLAD
jgi:hypothetical protein